jgi:predicted nucleic acid-binding Zn finger protein
MIEKTEQEKVELANEILQPFENISISTQDRIDVLKIALDSLFAKKRLNERKKEMQEEKEEHVRMDKELPKEIKERVWIIPSTSELNKQYEVEFSNGSFFCTCPDFKFRTNLCKHIKKVKLLLAGEKQKNKLPGVET